MKTQITLKNYRCFASPAILEIRKGYTAFTGANNAGKSAIMRFFLEFRPLLQMLSDIGSLVNSIASPQGFGPLLHVLDQEEVFSNLNSNPIAVTFDFDAEEGDELTFKNAKFSLEISRNRAVSVTVSQDGAKQPQKRSGVESGRFLAINGQRVIDLAPDECRGGVAIQISLHRAISKHDKCRNKNRLSGHQDRPIIHRGVQRAEDWSAQEEQRWHLQTN